MQNTNYKVTDCHTHIIGDSANYKMVSPRSYTPEPASVTQLEKKLRHAGITRVVMVQLSSYGLDNSCMLDAMKQIQHEVRGVVHTGADTSVSDLDNMHTNLVRGIRINLRSTGSNNLDAARTGLQQAVTHCARHGWHIQMHTTPDIVAELSDAIVDCPVPVVLDHFGMMSPINRHSKGETTIRHLLSNGHLWIKLSGTYRLDSADAVDPVGDLVGNLARELYSDNPDQLLWGSDWPHTSRHDGIMKDNPEVVPHRDFEPASLLADCRNWFDEDIALRNILYKNPETLYGFDK